MAGCFAVGSAEIRHMCESENPWTVITNAGKQAEFESGLEEKEVQKPTHISPREFVHCMAPNSRIDDDSLRSLFSGFVLVASRNLPRLFDGSSDG